MPQAKNISTADSATPKKKKKRRVRVRTKSCAKCHTPCNTITRCMLTPGGPCAYICDICWPTYCADNPGYSYQGTWQQGRIIDPPGSNTRE